MVMEEGKILPPGQAKILSFINRYRSEKGYGPTLDEVSKALGVTIPTVYQHVKALRRKGYLKSPTTNSRNLGIFSSDDEISEIPLLGVISAGGGLENVENPETIKVQKTLLSPHGHNYALLVRGTSMIDDGIMPDDIIIVKEQNYADNGDVVVALIEGNGENLATVKRFYNHGNQIELRPKNPELSPKMYAPGNVEIRGKFISLLRKG